MILVTKAGYGHRPADDAATTTTTTTPLRTGGEKPSGWAAGTAERTPHRPSPQDGAAKGCARNPPSSRPAVMYRRRGFAVLQGVLRARSPPRYGLSSHSHKRHSANTKSPSGRRKHELHTSLPNAQWESAHTCPLQRPTLGNTDPTLPRLPPTHSRGRLLKRTPASPNLDTRSPFPHPFNTRRTRELHYRQTTPRSDARARQN